MTDLTLASHAEIVAEINRRYPSYVLVVTHPIDGKPGAFGHRIDMHGQTGLHEPLGLARLAVHQLLVLMARQPGYVAIGTPPLDHQPPTPGSA